jgi:hypothetical protein
MGVSPSPVGWPRLGGRGCDFALAIAGGIIAAGGERSRPKNALADPENIRDRPRVYCSNRSLRRARRSFNAGWSARSRYPCAGRRSFRNHVTAGLISCEPPGIPQPDEHPFSTSLANGPSRVESGCTGQRSHKTVGLAGQKRTRLDKNVGAPLRAQRWKSSRTKRRN